MNLSIHLLRTLSPSVRASDGNRRLGSYGPTLPPRIFPLAGQPFPSGGEPEKGRVIDWSRFLEVERCGQRGSAARQFRDENRGSSHNHYGIFKRLSQLTFMLPARHRWAGLPSPALPDPTPGPSPNVLIWGGEKYILSARTLWGDPICLAGLPRVPAHFAGKSSPCPAHPPIAWPTCLP